MIFRIRERAAFDRLSKNGRRVRAGALWCTYLLDDSAVPPRVAFSVGRAVGSAVERNRVRRRLRALLQDSTLPPGWYLLGLSAGTAAPSFDELAFALSRISAKLGPPASSCE